ncbi:MAG: arginine deiminase [Bacteroidales bacterium]|nr:arginine deiminase [Bacteroidales bacterium]
MNNSTTSVKLYSEIGRLRSVLLHRPGHEVEAMTPANAHHALYSDILSMEIADREYDLFERTLQRCTQVYYVQDLLQRLLSDARQAENLVRASCKADGCESLADSLLQLSPAEMARQLIEGVPYRPGEAPSDDERYQLKPLYNLFFTRDAASCLFDHVLINSMSFDVRQRESLIYKALFEHLFGAATLWAQRHDPSARTEGGDVMMVKSDLLCVGNGIRTNRQGIDYLLRALGSERERMSIIVQELPHQPDSFIHLDMVFTFLGPHACMAYEPMLRGTGLFAGKHTTLLTVEGGKLTQTEFPNILAALRSQGVDLEPVLCGNGDSWAADREQWHSGANFFSFGENHIIGYRRNRNTIEALDHAGFNVLTAEEVADGKCDPWSYEKAVVTFAASELPRGGGGARCMTCPISRDDTSWD